MRIGWIGLGKLGLPCALTLAEDGDDVDVVGYDIDPRIGDILTGHAPPRAREYGLPLLLPGEHLRIEQSIRDVVALTDDLIFTAVQTPHGPEFGGETPRPFTVRDFDYSYLQEVARAVSDAADRLNKRITLVVISTALPGTMRREILPDLSDNVTLVYNPFFIAMGTTIADFRRPEFILIGADEPGDAASLIRLYKRLHGQRVPIRLLSLEEAELTKVAYNTFISMKIIFANTLMEICDQIGADVDHVTETLALGERRITSPAYLRGGMGDGGACHPRDNIAMAWLARKLGLSTDPFSYVTMARDAQSLWLANLVVDTALSSKLPIVILGKSYKAGSDLTYGSPALLLAYQIGQQNYPYQHHDPYVDEGPAPLQEPAVYVVATRHLEYEYLSVPPGSVVIDPWRYVHVPDGVTLRRIGSREDDE